MCLDSWYKSGKRHRINPNTYQAILQEIGSLGKGVVHDTGLFLRSDHGSQYSSRDFQAEVKYLGLVYSPAFVRSPECNGIIERFHRTLQEQVFDSYSFESIDEARQVITKFIDDYNRYWLIQRLGYCSPLEFRAAYQPALLKSAWLIGANTPRSRIRREFFGIA